MKFQNKIVYRLILYFSIVLLVFSIALTGLFTVLYKAQAVAVTREEMETRAVAISAKLTEYLSNLSEVQGISGTDPGRLQGGGQGQGYMAYLRILDEIAMSDVWIVDQDLHLMTIGGPNLPSYNYSDLPQGAETVVDQAFQGETTFSQDFSPLMSSATMTVGTPVYQAGVPVGVLLLHSPIKGIDYAVTQSVKIMIASIAISSFLAILASVLLAVSFTRPLNTITDAAREIGSGRYNTKTHLHRKDEIGELAQTIDAMASRLALAEKEREQLARMKHDFISNVSHELRTPVTVLRGSLEALYDGVVHDPIQVKVYYAQMLKESKYLQRLVEDLLDLSRLQNADFSTEFAEFSLRDLLDDVLHSGQQMAAAKEISIQIEYKAYPPVLWGDYGRIRQMLLILIDNAIKFSPHAASIQLIASEKSLAVIDQGSGILPEDLPYVFERFYASKSEENKTGTGLGLFIAKQIAERHGWSLTVSSIAFERTVFTLEFISDPDHKDSTGSLI